MKFLTNKNMTQKIIIAIVIVILFNFAVPMRSQAAWVMDKIQDGAADLVKEFMHLVTFLGDSVMNMLSFAMVGSEFGALNLEQDDPNLEEGSGSYVDPSNIKNGNTFETEEFKDDELDGLIFASWKVPNIIYCPENIFSNKIAALDVNFINPNEYKPINDSDMAEVTSKSAAAQLRPTIATWYRSFRNIAVVGLLSVLVYLGIRILIGSTAQDKAKYKERLKDWIVALCLVFIIHFIMSGILIITENITALFSNSTEQSIIVSVDNGVKFKTNLTGYIRFQTQISDMFASISYTILYMCLVGFTAMFTYTYLKRLLYMAFFTMIAPLVALTYPLDKAGDGKAQAFNIWFKEYLMNAILQPVHLLLYSALVTSAISLAVNNPVYAVAAIWFMIPAEKFIKKMFGFDKASTPGGLGSFAAGAVAMKAVSHVANRARKKSNSEDEEEGNNYTRPRRIGGFGNTQNPNPEPDSTQNSNSEPERDNSQMEVYENSRNMAQERLDEAKAEGFTPGDSEYDKHQQEIDKYNALINGNTNQNLTQEEERELEQAQQQRQLERRGFAGVWDKQKNNIKDNIYANGGVLRTAAKVGGTVGKKAAQVGGGIVLGTTVGSLMAATGDPSAIAQGLAAGVSGGAVIGGVLGKKAINAPKQTKEKLRSTVENSGWFTSEEVAQKQQARFDDDFKHDKKNIEFLRAQGEDPQEFLNDVVTQEFLNNDITDINAIYNARKLMKDKNVSQKTAIQAAKYAKDIPKGFKGNDQAKNAFVEGQMKNGKTREDANKMRDYIIAIQKDNRK